MPSPLPSLVVLVLAAPIAAGDADVRMSWDESIRMEASGELEDATSAVQAFLKAGGDRNLGNLRTGWLLYLRKDYDKGTHASSLEGVAACDKKLAERRESR